MSSLKHSTKSLLSPSFEERKKPPKQVPSTAPLHRPSVESVLASSGSGKGNLTPVKVNLANRADFTATMSPSATSSIEDEKLSNPDQPLPYVNDYRKIYKVNDPNPAAVIAIALKELVRLLSEYKRRGVQMFTSVAKDPLFEIIEKEAAFLRVNPGSEISDSQHSSLRGTERSRRQGRTTGCRLRSSSCPSS